MQLTTREQKLFSYLGECGFVGATTLEIQKACSTCAPGSDAADLRKKGIDVACEYKSKVGRKIYRYWLGIKS